MLSVQTGYCLSLSKWLLHCSCEFAEITFLVVEIIFRQRFVKVEKLRDKQDKWKETKLGNPHNKEEQSGSSGDEEDYAEFLDWRSKGAFKWRKGHFWNKRWNALWQSL